MSLVLINENSSIYYVMFCFINNNNNQTIQKQQNKQYRIQRIKGQFGVVQIIFFMTNKQTIKKISIKSYTKELFFEKFVKTRNPCIITEIIENDDFTNLKTLTDLQNKT